MIEMSSYYNMDTFQNEFYGSPQTLSATSPTNTDGSIGVYSNTMSSPVSSNMSPMSSTSDSSSAYSFHNLNISSANDFEGMNMTGGIHQTSNQPYLVITEQPVDKFRFRYKSEMHGTHGSLTGQMTSRSKKTFPTVRLHNFYGEAWIRCWLYQIQKPGHDNPSPHSHSLVIRSGNEDRKDPHEVMVSPSHGYTAVFQGMGIIHTARRYIEEELYGKLLAQLEFKAGRLATQLEEESLKKRAKKEAADMNLNQVSLCFEAFQRINSEWVQICAPVYSTPINNMKSALTGELKISRLSAVVGSATGNDDLFLFVEKVGKKNIKVRFFEIDEHENLLWEDWGKFTEADVHHQYAIALKTPAYKCADIEKSVKVFVQLYRPGDHSHSEPVEFRYKPSNDYSTLNNSRKRPRITSAYNSTEIPLVVTENMYCSPMQQKANETISTEFETQKLIDVLLSAADSTTPHINAQDDFNSFFLDSNVNLNSEEIAEIVNQNFESFEFDKLAKDAVAAVDMKPQFQSSEERFVVRILKNVWPLVLKCGNDDRNIKKGREFLDSLFKAAHFNNESLIHSAIRSSDNRLMEKLWELIHKFHSYNLLRLQNERNETCLHVASAHNKPEIVRELLLYGADVNDVDWRGDTALHVAVQENHDDCVKALLETKSTASCRAINIDLVALNYQGFAPLHLAVRNKNLPIVEMLEASAKAAKVSIFDVVEAKHGKNALHIAIESGATEIVKYIVKHKLIGVHRTNLSGHTSLYLARVINPDLVPFLLENNTESEQVTVKQETNDESSESSDSMDLSAVSQNTSAQSVPPKFGAASKLISRVNRTKAKDTFDDVSLTQLSDIFNKDGKWKLVAQALRYDNRIESWERLRNPAKVLFLFSESLKVSKDELTNIFRDLQEQDAVNIMNEWKQRN